MDNDLRIFWVSAAICAVIIAFILMLPRRASGQENHYQHHAQYEHWQSNAGFGCCNDKDCGTLPDKDVREQDGETQVLVKDPGGDQWCQVTDNHLVNQKNGKRPSPDWSVAHACILTAMPDRTPCDRFKCFMPAVKF